MKYIRSRTNPLVKQVVGLHTRKGRIEHKQFIAEGLRTCATVVKHCTLVSCYVTDTISTQNIPFIPVNKIIDVTDEVMAKMSTTESPSGILCVFDYRKISRLLRLKVALCFMGYQIPAISVHSSERLPHSD